MDGGAGGKEQGEYEIRKDGWGSGRKGTGTIRNKEGWTKGRKEQPTAEIEGYNDGQSL